MTSNLLLAAGVSYVLTGALLLLVSRFGNGATRRDALPAYPRLLARSSAARLDARFGAALAAVGAMVAALGLYGFSAPASLWRYPAVAGLAVLLAWSSARLLTLRPVHRSHVSRRGRHSPFDTRRSTVLRRAAEHEMAAHLAREIARRPRDTGIVYLRRRWDRAWWSQRLGASAADIEEAISRVGPMRCDVERYLAAKRHEPIALAA